MHSQASSPHVHHDQSGCPPPRPPPPVSWVPYDVYTMDALMLFSREQPPQPSDVPRVGRRRKQAPEFDDEEERRRASHREVQRRFMQRKQAEMAALRSNATKIELQYRTLLGEVYAEKLRDERAELLRECKERDIDVEDANDPEKLTERKLYPPLFQFRLESSSSRSG